MVLIEKITDAIQSSNINVLIGSGLSMPFIPTLGNIETLLAELDSQPTKGRLAWQIAKASLYKKYFDNVMARNIESNCADNVLFREVLFNYMSFYPYFIPLFYILLYLQNPPPAVSSERMAIQKNRSGIPFPNLFFISYNEILISLSVR